MASLERLAVLRAAGQVSLAAGEGAAGTVAAVTGAGRMPSVRAFRQPRLGGQSLQPDSGSASSIRNASRPAAASSPE